MTGIRTGVSDAADAADAAGVSGVSGTAGAAPGTGSEPVLPEHGAAQLAHGRWRVLAPAFACWVAAAATIHFPGTGRMLAWIAAVAGLAVVAVQLRAALLGRRAAAADDAPPRGSGDKAAWPPCLARASGRLMGASLIFCAALCVTGTRVEALERGRDAPALQRSAAHSGHVDARVSLAGYPAAIEGWGDAQRGWVRGHLSHVNGFALSPRVPVMLWLPSAPEHNWYPGKDVSVTGTLLRGPPEALSAYEMSVSSYEAVNSPPSLQSLLGRSAAALRHSLREASEQQDGAALVPGLAVGDTSLVDDDLDRIMLESSLTHLTAVSGSNCALVVTAVTAIAARIGCGRRLRILVASAALGGFVVLVGPDASVQRAAVMASVLLVSNFGGKRGQALPALGLATLVLLIADPWQAIQPGFALSVAATCGILLWGTRLEQWLRIRLLLPRTVALPLAVAAVAQGVCAPLLLLLQPGLPAGGVLANLLASPAAPVGTALGMLAMLALGVSATAGSALLVLAVIPARWIEAAGIVGVAVPGSRWHWPGGWTGALLLAAVYLLFGIVWALATGWVGSRGMRGEPWARSRAPLRPSHAVAVWTATGVAAGVTLGIVIVIPASVRLGIPTDWAVVTCDVGQGDALLLRDPSLPHEVMMVDTGEYPEKLRACLELFGVKRLGLLVLTHNDRDHVGAMSVVLPMTDAAIVAPSSVEDEGKQSLADAVRAAGVPVSVGAIGDRGAVGKSFTWELLGPRPAASYPKANATSLVLRLEIADTSVLLLADTGESEQLTLLRDNPGMRADIVKVAHHGSKDQSLSFYEKLGARLGLVSVGEDNRYGHPNAALLEHLVGIGTEPLRTDELGSIAVRITSSGMELWAAGDRSLVVRRQRLAGASREEVRNTPCCGARLGRRRRQPVG